MKRALVALAEGPAHRFADWPNPEVPAVAAGVYTIFQGSTFLYVGMSGLRLTEERIATLRLEGATKKGLKGRLQSHASGRRSSDRFCVYICDRLVLPRLKPQDIRAIGTGRLSLDQLTKQFIHDTLLYRFAVVRNGEQALKLETEVKLGALPQGAPLLNPG